MVGVVNFGGQYAHLIARRIRELGVKSELFPPDTKIPDIKKLKCDALIFSGSPASAYDKSAPKIDPGIYDLKIPVLGICYGQQLMALQLKGKVVAKEEKQFGKEYLNINKSPLFSGLTKKEIVWFSHGDQVTKLPEGFETIGSTNSAKIAAMQNLKKNFFGIQFHPEVTHTPNGLNILKNFLFNISNSKKDWDLEKEKKQIVGDLNKQIGGQKAVMAISGGVDSLVAATLLKEAIGEKLYLVFINTGFLRDYDISDLIETINKVNFKKVKIVDARSRFLKAVKNITDPEAKRRKIAKDYFKILEEEAFKIGDVKFLGQGTIYPDRIESAQSSKHADKIKSHHNVTLPKGLKLELVEPLGELYKDEVRKIGSLLNIPKNFLNRHPFPGPGLAIRILGEVTKERLEILKKADKIFVSELKTANIYNKVAQALAALIVAKTVGVMGDSRTYSYIITLRCVDTEDFMTADWSKIPNDILERISSRIVNEVDGVNRVVYDITQKPPATIEYE